MAEMLLRRADQTIFVSKYVRERAAVPSSGNYVVIHNGVDPDDWKTQGRRGSSLESSGLGESDGPILLLPAQLAEWKGQADAVRALAIIRSTFSTARLVLAGETKDPTPAARAANAAFVLDLERLIAELGLSSCVHLLGHVEDMSELYDLADVVLVPSFQEPFGRTVIEGMAAGRVVIATDEGGPPEIIQNGRTGILLPPRRPSLWAEEIARILSDRPRREAIAAAAEVSVRKDFSIERCVRDCLSSYGTAIQIETRRRHRASSVRQREGYADES
jgi:glycosyltransferase involved in cell wall biosynthesis